MPFIEPLPATMKHAWIATIEPDIEQVVSLGRKPVPVTFTFVPTEPIAGLRLIEGPAVTEKVKSAKSPIGLPVTRIT